MGSSSAKVLWSSAAVIPAVVTILCLVPFVGKAFHMDDPMYIWAARQIKTNPADFYGFTVNWYGTEMPMSEVTKNPPGVSHYIAVVGSLFGWSELALHVAFLIPAVAVVLGTYYLAEQFCSKPALAALAAVLTPVFLVSSTNIMADITMLAFCVWAVLLWVRGIKEDDNLNLFLASALIVFCALTKYLGVCVLGLFSVYALWQKRALGLWVLFLLIPVVILAGYQWATHTLYGRGLLLDAADYATKVRRSNSTELFGKSLLGLAFTGGCIITVLFYSPLLWSRRILVVGIVLTILLVFALTFAEKVGKSSVRDDDGVRWGFLIQLAVMAVTGLSLIGLAGADFWQCRNADSLLLLLWVIGIFIFASFINWTVNARSILPMVPAAGILLVRRVERLGKAQQGTRIWRAGWPLIPAAFVGLWVGWADYAWANTARSAAEVISKSYENHNGTVWFQGHWGFQYYMEANGHRALDYARLRLSEGDIIVVPSNNTNTSRVPEDWVRQCEVFRFTAHRWLATMSLSAGAGYYADEWGPLPFAIGSVEPEMYYAFTLK